MSAGTLVSLIIGGWGAVVATLLGVRELRRDKRNVHVECERRWGKMPVDTTSMGRFSSPALQDEEFVRVRVQNLGQRPVEPRHVFFVARKGRRLPVSMERGMAFRDGTHPLPRHLADGEAVIAEFPTRMLEKAQSETQTTIETVQVEASGELYTAPFPRE